MKLLHDRFLVTVLSLTSSIVLAMAVARIGLSRRGRLPAALPEPAGAAATLTDVASSPRSAPARTMPRSLSNGVFLITHVIDGDTVVLDSNVTVRLISVDTPEINHPEVPVQRFGQEAKEFVRRMAEGFECTLEYEGDDRTDKYGRVLAYVTVDGQLLNAEIIRRGYGYAYTRFPFKRQAEFMEYEREARARQYGLWNHSPGDGRIANLVSRYEALNEEGRGRLDDLLDSLAEEYPAELPPMTTSVAVTQGDR